MLYISLVTLLGQLSSFLVHQFYGFCSLEHFFHPKFEHAVRSMTNLVYSVRMCTVSPSTAPLTHSCSDLISNAFTSTLTARTRKRGHCSESPTGFQQQVWVSPSSFQTFVLRCTPVHRTLNMGGCLPCSRTRSWLSMACNGSARCVLVTLASYCKCTHTQVGISVSESGILAAHGRALVRQAHAL